MLAIGRVVSSDDRELCIDLAVDLKHALRPVAGLYDCVLAACRVNRPLGVILAREDYIDMVPRALRTRRLITEFSPDGPGCEYDADDDNLAYILEGECAMTMSMSDNAHKFMATIATPEDLLKKTPRMAHSATIAYLIALCGPYLMYYTKLLTADHLLSGQDLPDGESSTDTLEMAVKSDPEFARRVPEKVLREYYRRKSAE